MKYYFSNTNLLCLALFLSLISTSCKKDAVNSPSDKPLRGQTVFLINEGNFMWGNAHLSMYRKDLKTVDHDVFKNQHPEIWETFFKACLPKIIKRCW